MNEPGNLKGEPNEIMKQKRRVKMNSKNDMSKLKLSRKSMVKLTGAARPKAIDFKLKWHPWGPCKVDEDSFQCGHGKCIEPGEKGLIRN